MEHDNEACTTGDECTCPCVVCTTLVYAGGEE